MTSSTRRRLPETRPSTTKTFRLRSPQEDGTVKVFRCHATLGFHPDGTPGELFLKIDKQGSTISGLADGLAVAVSLGLQHGVQIDDYVRKFRHTRFEPSGATGDPDYPMASSLLDILAVFLEKAAEKALVEASRKTKNVP